MSCLDNLVKGAAGQALQNFNVAYGFDERTATCCERRARSETRRRAPRDARGSGADCGRSRRPWPRTGRSCSIHGGGRAIDAELDRRGDRAEESRRPAHHGSRDARRGRVGACRARRTPSSSRRWSRRGVPAVGLTGVDAGLGRATRAGRAPLDVGHRSSISALVGDPAETGSRR